MGLSDPLELPGTFNISINQVVILIAAAWIVWLIWSAVPKKTLTSRLPLSRHWT